MGQRTHPTHEYLDVGIQKPGQTQRQEEESRNIRSSQICGASSGGLLLKSINVDIPIPITVPYSDVFSSAFTAGTVQQASATRARTPSERVEKKRRVCERIAVVRKKVN